MKRDPRAANQWTPDEDHSVLDRNVVSRIISMTTKVKKYFEIKQKYCF